MRRGNFVGGSKTLSDGTRMPISASEADAIFAEIDEKEARRAMQMPDTSAALSTIVDGIERMKALGWRDGIYCPKDGSSFACCEFGSTGIWTGFYTGRWPLGHLMFADSVGRPEGMMWKPIDQLSAPEAETLARSNRAVSEEIDRMGRSFSDDARAATAPAKEADDDMDMSDYALEDEIERRRMAKEG